ncbi:hypothetical protein Ferp_0536 [Ferroglobus placidus DSM 10642]|uniref:Uncharacterized protein n=1 Tax=Ferroglobus placidus (strain DSM 10642 / AEDII12DO) TaxID=589924 RepID=D3S377_FERPA|nr:hypothetical protein [Ferroglobus placidus]ADC64710.1 hypothetical protein Ferp_0536 [Ferroglobus placidus DSM 10642]
MLVMSMLKGLHVVKSEELDWLTTFENYLWDREDEKPGVERGCPN